MKLNFSKMHGIGNDYVYVNCFEEKNRIPNPEKTACVVSDRHKGIGSDGLILIEPSSVADCRMRIFNADGSEGKMCGNGIRCVAKYVYEKNLARKEHLQVETASGIKEIGLKIQDGIVQEAEVDMGIAVLNPAEIPVIDDSGKESFIDRPVQAGDKTYSVTCVSMGNPHAVVFLPDEKEQRTFEIEKIGPQFEHHVLFPNRINTEFVHVIDERTIRMRVWERGSGETQACGTGACASVVASVLNGYCRKGEEITVQLLGGDLKITYLEDGRVIMRGSATHVFDGIIELLDD